MKTKVFFLLCLALFTAGLSAQPKRSIEEAAIVQVIESETHWFNRRDYNRWADCLVHDDETFCSWTNPTHGKKNCVKQLEGWKAISKDFKSRMAILPVDPNDPEKTRYEVEINKDRAYVTFEETGKSCPQIRVLKNIKGRWKILRMESLETETEDFAKK